MKTMGEIIKELRLKHSLTQEELGEIIGVQKAAIQKYENGSTQNMKRSSVEKLSKFFNVSPSYLMGMGSEEPSPSDELSEYLEHLRTRPEMKMLFSLTKDATKEDVEKAVRIIEAMLGKD